MYESQYEGNMKKIFQIPGPRGKLGILPSPRNMIMKKYEGNMKKYEGTMKKYEGNMKKYVGNMKIRTFPIIWAVGLEKISQHHSPPRPWDLEKIPVQVLAIETCFMSIDELLVPRILSKSRSPYIREELNMKEI